MGAPSVPLPAPAAREPRTARPAGGKCVSGRGSAARPSYAEYSLPSRQSRLSRAREYKEGSEPGKSSDAGDDEKEGADEGVGEEGSIFNKVSEWLYPTDEPRKNGEQADDKPPAPFIGAREWQTSMKAQSVEWVKNVKEEERVDDCVSEAYEAWQLRNYEGRIYARTIEDVQEVVRRCLLYAPKESSEAYEDSLRETDGENYGRKTLQVLRGSIVERQVSHGRVMSNIMGHLQPSGEDPNGEPFYSVVDIVGAIMASGVHRQIVSQGAKRFAAWHEGKTRKEVLEEKSHYVRSFFALVVGMLVLDVVAAVVAGTQMGLGFDLPTTPVLLASSCAFVVFSIVAIVGVAKHQKDM